MFVPMCLYVYIRSPNSVDRMGVLSPCSIIPFVYSPITRSYPYNHPFNNPIHIITPSLASLSRASRAIYTKGCPRIVSSLSGINAGLFWPVRDVPPYGTTQRTEFLKGAVFWLCAPQPEGNCANKESAWRKRSLAIPLSEAPKMAAERHL